MVFHPAQVSEREPDGTYEDCTWATGVMLWNARLGFNGAPNTRAEYEALRVAGGDGPAENSGDGSNYDQLALGMSRRYGWRPPVVTTTFDAAWGLFKPGVAMGWQGSMGGVNDYLRRWDVNFGANGRLAPHSVLAIRDAAEDACWWMNPLAPRSFPGERISKAMLQRYFEALPRAAITYTPVGVFELPDTGTDEVDMAINSVPGLTSPYTVTLPEGTDLFNRSDLTERRTEMSATVAVPYLGIASDKAIAVYVTTGGKPTILYAKRGIAAPAPVPQVDPDIKHTVTLAVDGQTKATVTV